MALVEGSLDRFANGHKALEVNDLPLHQRVRPTAWSQGCRLGPCPDTRAASAFMTLFTEPEEANSHIANQRALAPMSIINVYIATWCICPSSAHHTASVNLTDPVAEKGSLTP